jgi:hypothetical protein
MSSKGVEKKPLVAEYRKRRAEKELNLKKVKNP